MRKQAEQIVEWLSTDTQFFESYKTAIRDNKEADFFKVNGLALKVDAAKRLITEAMIKKRVQSGELTHEELDQVSGGADTCYDSCMLTT